MSDGFDIPAEFFATLSGAEFGEIAARGGLDAMQCARLWKMLGRSDPCPTFIEVRISRPTLAPPPVVLERLEKRLLIQTIGLCTLAIVAAIGSASYPGTLPGVVMYLCGACCAAGVVVMARKV